EDDKLYKWELDVAEQEFTKTNTEPFGQPKVTFTEVETDGENPQHVGVLNAWADAILHGGKLIAEGKEGINGLTISNAMHLS
ncbi:MAG: gfo/Idh/MocA family oxidoreductase, partial [Clostridia bacterium]|nr:gfo/Idh/MocA family oxidoreductase [Clostridia bacterium]